VRNNYNSGRARCDKKKQQQLNIYEVIFWEHIKIIYFLMKKRSLIPETRVKNPEPKKKDTDWIIWAAWADRITFEEIEKKTGKNESQVIKIMRRNLRPGSFRLWRKRVHNTSIKHRKKFKLSRKKMREKIRISDIY
tara:strand:+ start:21 stop:428 length:408 start_codon:yes stop_codon:yes gene_type:complete